MREKERVFLGMPGPWAEDYRETADPYTTKIGGVPDWPTPNINLDLVNCRSCGERIYLMAQVYSPTSSDDSKIEDRTIYVFCCPRPSCTCSCKGWRTLRVQKGKNQCPQSNGMRDQKLGNDDKWWANDDDDDVDLMKLSRAISEASSLARSAKKRNEPEVSEIPQSAKSRPHDSEIPVLPCFYLYDEEEKVVAKSTDVQEQCSSLSIKDGSNVGADSSDEERWEAESYEYDRSLGADRTYLKFKKRLEAHPGQCIRYSLGGRPLAAEQLSEEPIRCENCGAKRRFEMQLMPPLLFFLQQPADEESAILSLKHWNWMTVIVYTCSKSCSSEANSIGENWTVAEEATFVQWE